MDPPSENIRKLTTRPPPRNSHLGLREPPSSLNISKNMYGSAQSIPGANMLGHTSSNTSLGVYSMSEVAKHNTEQSAWMVFDGLVYNVTEFIHRHPGGVRSMLPYMGKDATEMFYRVTGHMFHQTDLLLQQQLIGRVQGYTGTYSRQQRQTEFEEKRKLRIGGGPKTFKIDFATKQVIMNQEVVGSKYHAQPLRAVTERVIAVPAAYKQFGEITLVSLWVIDPAVFFCQTNTAHLPLCNKHDGTLLRNCHICASKKLGYNVSKGTSVHIKLSKIGDCTCTGKYFTPIHIGETGLYLSSDLEIPSFVTQVLELYVHNKAVSETITSMKIGNNIKQIAVDTKFDFMQVSNTTSNFKFQTLVTGGYHHVTLFIQGSGIATIGSILERVVGKYNMPLKMHIIWCISGIDALLGEVREDGVIQIQEYIFHILSCLKNTVQKKEIEGSTNVSNTCQCELSIICSKPQFPIHAQKVMKEINTDKNLDIVIHLYKNKVNLDTIARFGVQDNIKQEYMQQYTDIWSQCMSGVVSTCTKIDDTLKWVTLDILNDQKVGLLLAISPNTTQYRVSSAYLLDPTHIDPVSSILFQSSQTGMFLSSLLLQYPLTSKQPIPSSIYVTQEPTFQMQIEANPAYRSASMICGSHAFAHQLNTAIHTVFDNMFILPL